MKTSPVSILLSILALVAPLGAQTLDEQLRGMPAAELARAAKSDGDPARGAVLFFQPHMACAKCHTVGDAKASTLGPDLAAIGKEATDELLVEAVLLPSKVIRKGFEPITVTTSDGRTIAGILVERSKERVVLRDVAKGGAVTALEAKEIEEVAANPLSIMPAGQVNQLAGKQQFLDLIAYLRAIRDGGPSKAKELQPSPALLTFTLPEYESHLDHAGLIRGWNGESLARGEAIYRRVCVNCHGTKEKLGSLPTSLRFAEGKFKNGSDPHAMYQTLTRGFGQMAAQPWLVPSQKYDVIHYIRETYLRPHNPSQLVAVDPGYLAKLPRGDTRGPEPSQFEAWSAMDYGPTLTHTYEVPGPHHNFAYKGIAVRLDPGAGGVSRGRHWMVFDTDTLRVAAAWSAAEKGPAGKKIENFIDWNGIQFDGEHGVHPKISGRLAIANPTGPGWANPETSSFRDDERVLGRDGKRYGPLPRSWGRYRGLYHYGQQAVISYSVGGTEVLEAPRLATRDDAPPSPFFLRTFQIGPRDCDLLLEVAEGSEGAQLASVAGSQDSIVRFEPPAVPEAPPAEKIAFNGATHLEVARPEAFDLMTKDFTIAARFKTNAGGTIFALAPSGAKWTPDGQALFVRDGRLCFDIGWVGAIASKAKVNDGRWHNVAATWQRDQRRLRLYVDGKLDGEGPLGAKAVLPEGVVRIGYTSPNFPSDSFFQGELAEVRFYQERRTDKLGELAEPAGEEKLVARWLPSEGKGDRIADTTGHGHDATIRRGEAPSAAATQIVAGLAPRETPAKWLAADGRLRLKIPAGQETLRFTLWTTSDSAKTLASKTALEPVIADSAPDLTQLTKGGPARWPQRLETKSAAMTSGGPFEIDGLLSPEPNPWLAQTRFTGLDFFADGRIAICSWDGDVWIVEEKAPTLRWQRIASGLFQPLGLKIVGGKIHVICRDQLAVLHDLNGDGETDFYECLNNDHQVTEHFHEFAMGLQTDAEGNFYYAKSGKHGLAATVPHHGTLLKVTKDGLRTEILANGFRAANGVCLNPDGSFVVTDQEGFWNPKNRINWVTLNPSGKPKFYGNMLGYHDVTDSSDAAMEPPLCWITNKFDRSPAELLWVNSKKWGPLDGSLLNLSYGYGKVFLVPHEQVGGLMQGGMIELPIPAFPTGVMRGRFSPIDGQLYVCGMFAWAGNATVPGGFYRIRATGQPMHLPKELHATKHGLTLTFTAPLDPASVNVKNFALKTWALKRTANYGSAHHDEKPLAVRGATLSADGKTVTLEIPDLKPAWCIETTYTLATPAGEKVEGTIHHTIHALGE